MMQWINCSERLPQQSDADWAGNVVTQTDQRYQIVQWDKVDKELDDYWLHKSEQAEGEGES